jgi:hypothetical protein
MDKWCEHMDEMLKTNWLMNWNYCPTCGTPRPVEKKVELPKKFYEPTSNSTMLAFNQLIDFLASEPWKK